MPISSKELIPVNKIYFYLFIYFNFLEEQNTMEYIFLQRMVRLYNFYLILI